MTVDAPAPQATSPESRPFEADVAKLLHLMVHSVYSDKDVFLRELVSNAADACEKLRFEAISRPELPGDDPKPRITLTADAANRRLSIEDNGVGMSGEEMVEALGTIARSGTKAFIERVGAAQGKEGAHLIGQFGVGFYSAFMVAERVEVVSRRAGADEASVWSSDGQGTFSVAPADLADAPARGTRVTLHLLEDAASYAEAWTLERAVKAQSGHVPAPVYLVETPGAEPRELSDGAALWLKPKSDISKEDYAEFYRGLGAFDEPAVTTHFRAEGRHEYVALAFTPSAAPYDLFDAERSGRMKLYVKRVFITDEAELLPRYLRFVRGLVDSSDLPLNVSREMIQESPVLAAIRKGVTNRVLSDLEKLADADAESFAKVWDAFGAVVKEGIYEDFERRDQLLTLARFRTTASGEGYRTLKQYLADLKDNQTAIYYLAGGEPERLKASPHLEGFRARGVEVLLLSDPIDSFWTSSVQGFEGKPFKSVTQGAADLSLIAKPEAAEAPSAAETTSAVTDFIAFAKATLGDKVSDVRASDRLTESPVCLVAPDHGPDRQLEKLLAGAGRAASGAKPVLEINPSHALVAALSARADSDAASFKEDAVGLLFDEARILDGERPDDAAAFSARLARVLQKALS